MMPTRDPRDQHLAKASNAIDRAILDLWQEWDLTATELVSILAQRLAGLTRSNVRHPRPKAKAS